LKYKDRKINLRAKYC